MKLLSLKWNLKKKVNLSANGNWKIFTNWCKSLSHRSCTGIVCDTALLGCMHGDNIHNAHMGQKTKEINVKLCI